MRSFTDQSGGSSHTPLPHVGDPIRWADSAPESLGAAGRLLVAQPPIIALPSDVAMRVRSNVLRAPDPSGGSTNGSSTNGSSTIWGRNAATLKLSGIAVGAALFGAGAMTALSSVQDSSELRVVIAPTPQATPDHGLSFDARTSEHRPAGHATAPEGAQQKADSSLVGVVEGQAPTAQDPTRVNALASKLSVSEALKASDRLVVAALGDTAVGGLSRSTGLEMAEKTQGSPAQPQGNQYRLEALSAQASTPVAQASETNGKSTSVGPSSVGSQGARPSEQELELLAEADTIERPVVRPQFRRVTAARKPTAQATLSTLEQETLLLEDARSKLGRAPDAALTLALEHQTRFRQGQLLEQRRMIHLEALLRLGRDDEAKKLASSIGSSIYQARANALLVRYGIVVE